MAATELFANTLTTTVSSGGTSAPSSGTTETWTVAANSGWPAAAAGVAQFHVADLTAASELIAVTNVSGHTWTVTRGAESTTPVAHIAGFTVFQVISAGFLTSPVFSGAVATAGLPGATAASRYAGATTLGLPSSGTFATGDFVIDQSGAVWICAAGGTPGTWATAGSQPITNGLLCEFVQWSASASTFPAVPGVLHLASAAGGNVVMQLPPTASVPPGGALVVKRVDSAGNTVTVQPASGEHVNGMTGGVVLSQQGQGRWFWPNAPAGAAAGTGWMSY